MTKAVIIDYGIVNLKNIRRGLEHVGGQVATAVDPDTVFKADRVILPGVGAFESGIKELRTHGMDEAIKYVASAGRPVLGICLGMQMLLGSSFEYGEHKGLDLIPGKVEAIPTGEPGKRKRKIPHIGWNSLMCSSHSKGWEDSCLDNTQDGAYFYFCHSFMAVPKFEAHVLAQCDYEGLSVTAAIMKDNVTGLQFHPERSGPEGLNVLRHFLQT